MLFIKNMSIKIYKFTIIIAIFTLNFLDFSIAINFSHGRKLNSNEIPSEFYHWQTANQSRVMSDENDGTELPLKRVSNFFAFAQAFPSYNESRGLFTWSNPITAIGFNERKFYAPEYPHLLMIQPTDKLNAIMLTSVYDNNSHQYLPLTPVEIQKEANDVDLILHINYGISNGNRVIRFQEWLILNPKKFASYTTSSIYRTLILKRELKHLNDVHFKYDQRSIHSIHLNPNDMHLRNSIFIPYIKKALESTWNPGLESDIRFILFDPIQKLKCENIFNSLN